jgi:hypothetical protein
MNAVDGGYLSIERQVLGFEIRLDLGLVAVSAHCQYPRAGRANCVDHCASFLDASEVSDVAPQKDQVNSLEVRQP